MMTVYEKAMVVVRGVAPVMGRIAKANPDLGRQLSRALCSVPLNAAEAEHARGGRGRASYGVALGSAREVRACLEVSEALGYVGAIDAKLRDDLDHVIAMLYRLSR